MASLLTTFLQGLTPPPFQQPEVRGETYTGWELRWNNLVFRPALFVVEPYILSFVAAYILFIFWGKSQNARKVNAWFDAHLPIFAEQFTQPSVGGLNQDGYSDWFNFSTGRKGVTSLHTVFTLRPRHDLLQYAYQFLRPLVDLETNYKDEILLDFTLASGTTVPDGVWAVVAKDELLYIRQDRWDLTFTRLAENSSLPPALTVLSELADITENLLSPKFPLLAALSDPKILPYFRSLSVTDQPRSRPSAPLSASARSKHVLLSLSAPPPSDAAATMAFVNTTFALVDALSKLQLRPESRVKIAKKREETYKDLAKEVKEREQEALQDAGEDKKALKKRAEDERISKLSAAEQAKILEKERKRALKKTQGKVVRK